MGKILEYKKLLRLLRQRGSKMPLVQKKRLIRRMIALEQVLASSLLKQMLTGDFTLNISQLPKRLQKLLSIMLNRRLHIIHLLERMRKQEMKNRVKRQKEIDKIGSIFSLSQNKTDGLGVLSTRMTAFQAESDNNVKKRREMMRKLQSIKIKGI